MPRARRITVPALAAALALVAAAPAAAAPELAPLIQQGWKKRGAARFEFLIWTVYDAELWTPGGAAPTLGAPMALALTYRSDFTEAELVKSTVEELARIQDPSPAAFARRFDGCFGDVSDGARVTAVAEAPDRIAVYRDGARRCAVEATNAARRFLGIWLGENTRDRGFTRRLRGER